MAINASRRGLLRGTLGATGASLLGCRSERARELGHHPDPGATTAAGSAQLVQIRVDVNTQRRNLEVDADASALTVVREQLGLHGAKLACGHGACGACTLLVDGTPVVGCLLPATSLHGKTLTTVEGLASAGALHPVQRAFMAEDALQCGFCTPGFVVAGTAFYGRWRAAHADKTPTREQVADALAGHLCRCGAHENIMTAVQRACAGKYEQGVVAPPRHEARDKVTGAAMYTVDVRLPDMLKVAMLRSPYAHATVKKVDWSQALALPGVAGAVDLMSGATKIRLRGPGDRGGRGGRPAHGEGRAGAHRRRLRGAAGRDRDEGRARSGAPRVYPERSERLKPGRPQRGPAAAAAVGWQPPRAVLAVLAPRRQGPACDPVRCATSRRRGTWSRGPTRRRSQCHSCLEPHACVAHWHDDRLTVHLSTQAVRQSAEDIAARWRLKEDQVRVLAEHVGGGFGGKATLCPEVIAAVELTRLTGKPVRVVLDRREELTVGGTRPAIETRLSLATDKAGALLGVAAQAHSDGGAAVGSSSCLLLRIMYADAPKDIDDYDVTTHAPPSKPFRAPGGPPAFWALEQSVDEAAHALGIDPIALRRRWDPNPARKLLYDWAAGLPIWKDRPRPQSDRGRMRRGVGVAVGGWMYFVEPAAQVRIDARPAGIVVSTASQDVGNGTRTVLAQVVSAVLGVAPASLSLRIGDSRYVPGPMAGGSRTTASVVPAARTAAEQLRDELVARAASELKIAGAPGMAGSSTRVDSCRGRRCWRRRRALHVIGDRKRDRGGWFFPPLMGGLAVGKYVPGRCTCSRSRSTRGSVGSRCCARSTGRRAARSSRPTLARSQVLGGVTQAISYALYEERRLDPRGGQLLTGGLEDYRIAGLGDVGELTVHFEEGGFPNAGGVAPASPSW